MQEEAAQSDSGQRLDVRTFDHTCFGCAWYVASMHLSGMLFAAALHTV